MKKLLIAMIFALTFTVSPCVASTSFGFDFTGFEEFATSPDSIDFSNGTITFYEDFADDVMYFANDQYVVDPLACSLFFNYDLTIGQSDFGDSLRFDISGEPMFEVSVTCSGLFEFDMIPYRGNTISIDWGLIWNGDGAAGSKGVISNVNLITSPVPIPASYYLLISGIFGLMVSRKVIWSTTTDADE